MTFQSCKIRPPLAFFVFVSVCLTALVGPLAHSELNIDLVPERRENPTKTEQGFLAFPIYTHVPGIGSTFGVGFLESNILKTRTNVLGAATIGDSSFIATGLTEVHITKELFFNFYGYSTRIPFQQFDRGMSSEAEGYVNLFRKEYGGTAELNWTFWERRLQLNAMIAPSRLQVTSARTPNGVRLNNNDNNEVDTLGATTRLQLDLTDDDLDPRRGFKAQVIHHVANTYDVYHSRYYSVSGIATAFVPIGPANTLAFNFFRSGSVVSDASTASAGDLRSALGLNCSLPTDVGSQQACNEAETRRVNERLNENKYGTAGLLGGPTQLRGFPIGRFRGSQSIMYGTEFRWNVTDENTHFDFGFIRGARSLLQIAPFVEAGAAVDPPQTVEQAPLQWIYGVGFRMGFSGALLRADFGMAHEGPQFTFFFGYPWDLSIL